MMLYGHLEFEGIFYDPETGDFLEVTGKRSFREMKHGHLVVSYKGKSYLAHRLAWFLYFGVWPKETVDHINGNPKDNRIVNLRDVPHSSNTRNCSKRVDNTSGVTGVYFHKPSGKWQARGYLFGKARSLGLFENKESAMKIRKEWEEQNGYHKNHGR
jgi:hypothetical protein